MTTASDYSPEHYQELSTVFSDRTISAIHELKREFEKGLGEASEADQVGQLYKFHAQRMRVDMLNRFPFTKNYPYIKNEPFISPGMLPDLPFLTNACGYQVDDNEIVNFLCFAQENDLFKFLQSTSKSNSLITKLIDEYNSAKGMTPSIQHDLLMESIDQLDFDRQTDQLFYAFFHITLNEEWVTSQSIQK
jgi:hypothetical protein